MATTFLLERSVKTVSGNSVSIKSNNPLAKLHFDNPQNWGDFIINQINGDEIYKKFLNSGSDLTILDIGGNVGLFALHCVDCAKIVYSFEPTPKHYCLLKEFTKDHTNIVPVNIAISDSDGDIDFYLCDNNTTMNSIENKYGSKLTVKGQSIISFIKEKKIDKVDFIKCDIEGSEMIALKEECIKPLFEIVDKWFIEVHGTSTGGIEDNRNILINNFQNVGYKCQVFGTDTMFIFK